MGIVSMNGVSSAFFGKVEQFLQYILCLWKFHFTAG